MTTSQRRFPRSRDVLERLQRTRSRRVGARRGDSGDRDAQRQLDDLRAAASRSDATRFLL